MSAITSLSNHQIRLASRPVGLPTRDNWNFTTEAVTEPGPGGVLVKTLYLSLDPAMNTLLKLRAVKSVLSIALLCAALAPPAGCNSSRHSSSRAWPDPVTGTRS